MSLRDELQAIYDEHGKLTPEIVVEAARPKNHPLHDRLEWDNRIAGPAWRRHQAHELITSCKVTYKRTPTAPEQSLRAFQPVRTEDPENGGYRYEPSELVAQDPLMRAIVLRDMERDWKTLQARYDGFTEFVEMVRRDIDAA